ncbi:SRPBCC family protein [Gordonia sp. (in: high G+C Gram-positive bacteria)]|uniref:SRPBCC family protein n=1 Tax=Gordonia sp. (in: high G+C Gram-positive bacteria) TaxID=84139 RepID=UPI003F9555C4
MARWTELTPVDETYFSMAKQRFSYRVDVNADADDVWAEIASTDPLPWVRSLDAHYTTPEPLGVGARRAVSSGGGLIKFREYFFRWDDRERRHSFYATEASVPFFRSFAEDYLVETTATGCSFTWTFAFDPAPRFGLFLAAGRPLNHLNFSRMAADTRRHFGKRFPKEAQA